MCIYIYMRQFRKSIILGPNQIIEFPRYFHTASAGQHFRTNVGCCVLLARCPETGRQTRCSQTVSNATSRVTSAQLPPGFRSCVGKFTISEACSILTNTNNILLPRYFRTASASFRTCMYEQIQQHNNKIVSLLGLLQGGF